MVLHFQAVQSLTNATWSLTSAVINSNAFCFLSQHITNPRKAAGQQDLVVNNPLSQDEGVSVCLCVFVLLFYLSLSVHQL